MLEFYLYMFIYMFKVSVWLMHVSCTLLFIVHYWVTTKHILIPDSSVSFFLPLLLLWRGRAIKVGSGRVRQGMWACRESARGSSAPWEKKLRGILEGRKGKKEEKIRREARARHDQLCAHRSRSDPSAPETRARADMKRPCEDTTSDSDMDETIDVGSENNYPA